MSSDMYSRKLTLYPDRIGVLIGKEGSVKKKLEDLLNVSINVNSDTGEVLIKGEDPERVLRASQIIEAINYGFSPERAFTLLSDDQVFHVVDLSAYVGKSIKDLKRVKGRIIGEKGKARRVIEETAKVQLSIYRHYVAIIGSFSDVLLADEAIRRLIKGSPHKAVYNFLFAERRREKFRKMFLWE